MQYLPMQTACDGSWLCPVAGKPNREPFSRERLAIDHAVSLILGLPVYGMNRAQAHLSLQLATPVHALLTNGVCTVLQGQC